MVERQTINLSTKVIKPDEVKSQGPSRTCVWRIGDNGWTWVTHHRFTAGYRQDWLDEFSLQHEALATVD